MDTFPTIRSTRLLDLLLALHHGGESGLLQATGDSILKRFLVTKGTLVLLDSTMEQEDLFAWFQQQYHLTEVFEKQERYSVQETMHLLFDVYKLTAAQFRDGYFSLVRSSVLQMFSWPSFYGEFFQVNIGDDPLFRVPVADILLHAVRKISDESLFRLHVLPDNPLELADEGNQIAEEFPWNPEEIQLLDELKRRRLSFLELQQRSKLDADQLARMIGFCVKVGIINQTKLVLLKRV